jgi:hypothetical protein
VQSRIDLLGERLSARVLRRGPERRERISPAASDLPPVDAAHQEDLEGQMDLVRMAIELEGPADLGSGPSGAEHRESFLAHFAELEQPLAQWNDCIERMRAAPGVLWTWLERAANKRGIEEPPYSTGALIDRLAIVTAERSRHGQLRIPYELRLERFSDRVGAGERLSLHAEGQKVVQIMGDQHAAAERALNEAAAVIQALFDEAQGSKAAAEVGDARDAMLDLKQPLLEALASAAAQDPITVAEACPVCRRMAEAAQAAEAAAAAATDDPAAGDEG